MVQAGTAEVALSAGGRMQFDIALLDIGMEGGNGLGLVMRICLLQPLVKVVVIMGGASVEWAVRAMMLGAVDVLCEPCTTERVAAAVERAAELRRLESAVGVFGDCLGTAGAEADFATTSELLRGALAKARQFAATDEALLIRGEAGSGRRVLARAVHGWGDAPEDSFFGIDCAAYSVAYVDLAVFGDSVFGNKVITAERPPLVRRSNGTMRLSHVEALTPTSQKRLAKLIATRQCELLDGKIIRMQDVRVVATATAGAVLEDSLFAAFGEGMISLPALRERAEDIPMLAQRYLGYLRLGGGKMILGFSPEAMDALVAYDWPGNLGELRGVVGLRWVVVKGVRIEISDLPEAIREFRKTPSERPRAGENVTLAALEAAHIRAVVAGSPSLRKAAERLGLDFQALYRRRKEYGLE